MSKALIIVMLTLRWLFNQYSEYMYVRKLNKLYNISMSLILRPIPHDFLF